MPIVRRTGSTKAATGLLSPPLFDPTYGYDLDELDSCCAPFPNDEPRDFDLFWSQIRSEARAVDPDSVVGEWRPWRYRSGSPTAPRRDVKDGGYEVAELSYLSLGRMRIGGWVVRPIDGADQIAVCGHGYGGRSEPACDEAAPSAMCVYPVARGLPDASPVPGIGRGSGQLDHVIWGIESPETYAVVLSAADFLVATTVAHHLFTTWYGSSENRIENREGSSPHTIYHGGSFGAGAGVLMLSIDDRFDGAILDVPTFGNQAERVTQECLGSGQVAREYWLAHPSALETLRYADAASAAKRVTVPVFATPALADAVVPPPGQFAVVNSLAGPVWRHALAGGHGEWTDLDSAKCSDDPSTWVSALSQPARPTPFQINEFLKRPTTLN